MALQKTPVSLNFAQGLNQKADPYQLPIGEFQSLTNSVFDKAGRLTKRNGFNNITTLPITLQTNVLTYNDNLVTTGSSLYTYSSDLNTWTNKGLVQPIDITTQSLIRSSSGQSAPDTAVAANGLCCLVYLDTDGNSYYQISDSSTGNIVVARTLLPNSATAARVVILQNYFLVTFLAVVAAAPHLQYIAIPISTPTAPGTATDVTTALQASNTCYDVSSTGPNAYFAWMNTGNLLQQKYVTSSLTQSSTSSTAIGFPVVRVAVNADPVANIVWAGVVPPTAGAHPIELLAFDLMFAPLMAATTVSSSSADNANLSIIGSGRLCYTFSNFEGAAGDGGVVSGLFSATIQLPATGTGVGTNPFHTNLKFLAIASKPFITNGNTYVFGAYGNRNNPGSPTPLNSNQPTYFLIDWNCNIYAKLAYANGGGYPQTQVVPNVSLYNNEYVFPYQITDFLASTNKGTALPSGTPTSAIYTQTGINLAFFSINTAPQYSSEIASALHLTGGQLWEYDGSKPVEHGFDIWPEGVLVTTSTLGGSIGADTYFYVFTYEWTDNQGMLHRSAPSIPFKITTTGSTSTNTITINNLSLTAKLSPNPVRIVGYRYSTNQPVYYQFTSITSPQVNDPTTFVATFTDALNNTSILGNTLLYTTGGVVENIGAPASSASALFNNRLWLVDAEDRNLLWFSKQVIENTPVEMSDLLTLYVAPTTGAQGSTGPITAVSAMDDKLIIFKKDAIYYVNGVGPDNAGSNSQYSDPVFITAAVGCDNPNSIVLMPNGLMFQSDKGIWLLGRGLNTEYIGAQVEDLSLSNTVVSAKAIPATNQVRFVLDNSEILMYDYFYNQWAVHTDILAISSTLYQSAHTYLNSLGQIFQEASGVYSDGGKPVLMSFTTSWISVAGLQGFERFYFMYLLGTYISPFKLNMNIAYDFAKSPQQAVIVTPSQSYTAWGDEALWGDGPPWGGQDDAEVFRARIFPKVQKCETFQVSVQELFDDTLVSTPGEGLTLSGLSLIVGIKKGYRTQRASRSFG